MKTILVTGASGFVGYHFCYLNSDRYIVKKVSLLKTLVKNIDFSGIDVILHLSGIAHRMEKTEDSLYYDVNYKLTKELAEAAKMAKVEHFIFVSTIKVYGDDYELLTPNTECRPNDAYGKSKLMAEEALTQMQTRKFCVSIVRPPLIYGPEVKGNMQKIVRLVEKRTYIPLGKINNRRSMVGVRNFIALLNQIINIGKSGMFLTQDAEPISTSQLIKQVAIEKKSKVKLISIPYIFRFLLKKTAPEIYKRLFGSLIVDDSETRELLKFQPPFSFEEEIGLMVKNN